MNISKKLQQIAHKVIQKETDSLNILSQSITLDFVEIALDIFRCKGRVIVTGMGKSSLVGRKIVATFNSIGKSSTFLHSADAIHGDIGMVKEGDIVLLISKSGNTPELKTLIPQLKSMQIQTVGLVSKWPSYVSDHVDKSIFIPYSKEADPYDIIPTSSVITQMAVGDILAMMLIELSHFTEEDFARNHPGGMIGKELCQTAGDLVSAQPLVQADASLEEIIYEISSKRLGATAVMQEGKIVGVITDGDLRRALGNQAVAISTLKANDIMSSAPKVIASNTLITQALQIIKTYNITQLVVMDDQTYIGIIHLHDILREGFVM